MVNCSSDTIFNTILSATTSTTFAVYVLYLFWLEPLRQAAIILWFAVVIISLYWFYISIKNMRLLGAKEIFSPRMAVIWWFIPILNLWKPYQLVGQIWKASNPQVVLSNGTEWKDSNSNLVKVWWILSLSLEDKKKNRIHVRIKGKGEPKASNVGSGGAITGVSSAPNVSAAMGISSDGYSGGDISVY